MKRRLSIEISLRTSVCDNQKKRVTYSFSYPFITGDCRGDGCGLQREQGHDSCPFVCGCFGLNTQARTPQRSQHIGMRCYSSAKPRGVRYAVMEMCSTIKGV